MSLRHHISPSAALRRLGFKQTIRGAVIIGLLIGLVMGAQGAAYNEAYPTEASRHSFVHTLDVAPALGFMAGETINASEPASYSIYKSIVITTLITAIWGLLATTRLLRGQEEDGRAEALLAGSITKRQASIHLLLGFAGSFSVSWLLAFGLIAALGQLPGVALSGDNAALLTLGGYLPGIVFAGLGILTSQLALTRGRAVTYGLVPLLGLFIMRGAANSTHDLDSLKRFTPFGWADLLNPVLGPHPLWLLPPIICGIIFAGAGLLLAGRRDLGTSLLRESDTVKPRWFLLRAPMWQALRLQKWTFAWWAIGALAFTGLMTGLAKLSVDILKDASGAQAVISKLGQSANDMAAAFIGIGNLFVVMILLIMVALLIGSIRRDEAKGYIDNLLVQPIARSRWLGGRLLLIASLAILIPLAAALLTWYTAQAQDLGTISLAAVFKGALGSIAVVLFALGVGGLTYSVFPRLAVAAVAIIITWSYGIDIFKAVIDLPSWVEKTSLLHYVSASPLAEPNWAAIIWFSLIGGLLILASMAAFTKRDIISE
ncbi:MAG TPA: ABC transporter permease subunit [Verrucomicrobiae bacterium]|jgi:ABC-2 type transport system permease protein|nr:ABC transporter permease subunit [Verrucomicrobiae bacterium]